MVVDINTGRAAKSVFDDMDGSVSDFMGYLDTLTSDKKTPKR